MLIPKHLFLTASVLFVLSLILDSDPMLVSQKNKFITCM